MARATELSPKSGGRSPITARSTPALSASTALTASSDIVQLNNHGTISGGQIGVSDTGGHFAEIYNSGAIDGGAGFYAVYSDAATSETLINYATGTISGGIGLNVEANVTNEGSIIGGALLAGVTTLVNSGTMDLVDFTSPDAGSSFSNSGLLTGDLDADGASFLADNSGTIDGAVNLSGDSASLTDSGTIEHGVTLAGSASGTTDVTIASTGVVKSLPGYGGLAIQSGAYDIQNDGEILAGFTGVDLNGGGTLVNDGKIVSGPGGDAVYNNAGAGVTAYVDNYGSIDSLADAVHDTGGHTAVIVNYGALSAGAGYHGVYADSSTLEDLTNAGTIDGGVWLNAAGSTVDNSGTIENGTSVSGAGVLLSGAGSSLTDSGTINDGVVFGGGATGTSVVRITSKGLVTNLSGGNGLQIAAGAYDISNAGEIQSSYTGVDLNGGGQLVNRGKIVSASGGAGVYNDAAAGAVNDVYNYGSIDALGDAVYDTGGHIAHVVNYGSLTGGPGYYAVYADQSTVESLVNAGSIEGGVVLGAAGSTIFNTGTIDGYVDFGGGSDRFTNEGLINGDIIFSGAGNVYDGTAGSVTGTIHGSGANGVYYGGTDGETFDMTASGAQLVVGGTGDNTFIFTAAGLTNATTIEGGGGTVTDTLEFSTPGAITASQLHHVSGIERIDLASGTNSITLTKALVASANGASLTIFCASGSDTIDASGTTSSDKVTIDAGQGVDAIKAGGGTDTFYYASGSYSSGPNYDTISGANYALDKFDLNGAAVTEIDAGVTVGSLSTATFNSNLAAAIGASHLLAHSAVLFTPNAGTLAGHTFLIADTVGLAGYHAGQDLVADVTGAKGTLSTGNFI
jgi:hypothetical protein